MKFLDDMNYLKRITLYNPTIMKSMVDLVAISVTTLRIDSGALWKKSSLN